MFIACRQNFLENVARLESVKKKRPKLFISYAWETDKKENVTKLCAVFRLYLTIPSLFQDTFLIDILCKLIKILTSASRLPQYTFHLQFSFKMDAIFFWGLHPLSVHIIYPICIKN